MLDKRDSHARQGISNAIGLAIAETSLAAEYNTPDYKLFDDFTYVICGDGCLQEGVSAEASSLAGHLGLGKLIVFHDDNNISIDGDTELSFTEDVMKRYEAYGWHVQEVTNVITQLDDLRAAVNVAKSVTDKPSMIKCKTLIGNGSPSKHGSHEAHGAPLGSDDLAGAKEAYGLPKDKIFYVAPEVQEVFTKASELGEKACMECQDLFNRYMRAFPEKAQEIQRRFAGQLPEGVFDELPKFVIGQDKDLATRKFSEKCINAIAPKLPEFIGGSPI